jgi:hypothetical protein
MKKSILMLSLLTALVPASQAQDIKNESLGSGVPMMMGSQPLYFVGNGLYALEQYLPNHPTAATIYPRIVDVNCTQLLDTVVCEGYNWLPSMGRGEYLFVRPHVVLPVASPVPTIVYKEVPAKRKGE